MMTDFETEIISREKIYIKDPKNAVTTLTKPN